MNRLLAGLLALFLAAPAVAVAQPNLSNLPAQSVVGRLGIGSGPAQAIPFAALGSALIPFLPALPGLPGVISNTRIAKIANYTVTPADCGSTIYAGGNAQFTITFGTASGYPATCAVMVFNEDVYSGANTARSKIVSINSAASLYWPGQGVIVQNDNNAWKTSPDKHRWLIPQGVQMYVNGSSGSDAGNNDCLASASPCQTNNRALNTVAFNEWQHSNSATTEIQVNFAGTALTSDSLHLAGLMLGQSGNLDIVVDGGSSGIWATTTLPPVSLQDGATITVQNITLGTSGGNGQNCAEANRGAHLILNNVTFQACDAAEIFANEAQIEVGSGYHVTGNALFSAQAINGGQIGVPGGVVNIDANVTFSTAFASAQAGARVQYGTSTVALNTHTVTGTRFTANSNSIIQSGVVDGNLTYFPGTVAGTIATGSIYDGLTVIPVTVANLPGCGGGVAPKGTRAMVSDANSTTFHATAAGSGSNIMSVFCDGTNWYLD